MFLYYVLLIDLAGISTTFSAFVLVCLRMLTEVGLFLGAFGSMVLVFSSGISVLKHDIQDFAGIQFGAYSLFRMTLGVFAFERYGSLRAEPAVLTMVFFFGIATVAFLLNMLIAQLSCAYSAVYQDMVGYARLQRACTIVEIMPTVPKSRWTGFVDSLHLWKRLEFNQGDVGVTGGIRQTEPPNLNPTTVDHIRRFGGSTSPEIPWPEDEENNDDDDKLERVEKLIQKTMARCMKLQRHDGKKGGRGGTGTSGTGTGTGVSGSGTKSDSENKSSEGEQELV